MVHCAKRPTLFVLIIKNQLEEKRYHYRLSHIKNGGNAEACLVEELTRNPQSRVFCSFLSANFWNFNIIIVSQKLPGINPCQEEGLQLTKSLVWRRKPKYRTTQSNVPRSVVVQNSSIRETWRHDNDCQKCIDKSR